MKHVFSLDDLSWRLSGYHPEEWLLGVSAETGVVAVPTVGPVPAKVPGSVQQALRDAGELPDWNLGVASRDCEWVENRHWIYETDLPDDWFKAGKTFRLRCLGLDYCGSVRFNNQEIARFRNSHKPCVVDLTPHLREKGNRLQIVFECPPRWLGQFGRTSEMRDWKPRFYYTWDWVSRIVQAGIWNSVLLEAADGCELGTVRLVTGADADSLKGWVEARGPVAAPAGCKVRLDLIDGGNTLKSETISADTYAAAGFAWRDLDTELWWPNGMGDQRLYTIRVTLLNASGAEADHIERRVGFRHIGWQDNEDAPDGATPWICVVNGRPVFLRGVNWTPIRPNFADVPLAEYEKRVLLYKGLHMNAFRVWGGAFLEKECFYDLCDEQGFLVWQEFPLSSSGIENYPPDDPLSIAELGEIARGYIERRRHHACLFIWCGGNELFHDKASTRPVDATHPVMVRFREIVEEMDPSRRFLTSTPSGPSFGASRDNFGKGVHWAVNGPWKAAGKLEDDWLPFWRDVDALAHTELGCPGPSDADLTRRYAGNCDPMPVGVENALWRRSPWWIESDQFAAEIGRKPESLEEYVAWGQERQTRALRAAAESSLGRFPKCGAFFLWMGHDCFPCTANTAIIDFEGNLKPAARALGEVFAKADP
jgi:beta-mannosidase